MRPRTAAQKLLEWALDDRLGEAVAGDLEELYAGRAPGNSRLRASGWYWSQTLRAIWRLGGRRRAPAPRGDRLMLMLLKDLRHGARLLRSAPSFSLAAVLTLALAIGANSVIFSLASLLILRPLPLASPERLAWIFTVQPQSTLDRWFVSLPEYAAFRDRSTQFEQLGARSTRTFTLSGRGDAERVLAKVVTGNLQGIWGLKAHLGRLLGERDERPGAPRAVVLSYTFWAERFGASPSVLGESLRLDGEPYEIVGVMWPDIEIGNLSEINVWTALQTDPRQGAWADRAWKPTGRLRPGATVADAHAEVSAIARQLEREQPDTNRGWVARVVTTKYALAGANTWLVLSLLLTVVGALLLLACANVMNLLIARLIGRQRELAVRTALGATRGALVRQIVAECVLLGAAGGAIGLLLAWAGVRGIQAAAYEPFFRMISIDTNVVLFAVILSLVAPVLFATLPALRIRADVRSMLGEASTRTVGGRATRGRNVLVAVQVALAVVLLIVAGLVVRTAIAATREPLGYESADLLMGLIDVPTWKYGDESRALQVRERLIDELGQLPGVRGVATTTAVPVLEVAPALAYEIERRTPGSDERPQIGTVTVSRAFFAVSRIPLLTGRTFDASDGADSAPVAVVSQEAARRFWGGPERALGDLATYSEGRRRQRARIVGIVGDTANPDLESGPLPQVYLLDAQHPSRRFSILLRADNPLQLAASVRRVVRELDEDLAIYKLRTVDDGFQDERSSLLILTSLFMAFAGVAVLLAACGLYGVMAYAVSQRAPEIAVRMALGASAGTIGTQILREGMRVTMIGLACGLAGALVIAQFMASILFKVTPTDAVTYGTVIFVTFATALPAVWIPARRAVKVDPIENLRQA